MRIYASLLSALLLLPACGGETALSAAPYDLASVPGQVDFGTTGVGIGVERTFTIVNQGSGSAEIANTVIVGASAGQFWLPASWDGTLGGESSIEITAVFEPMEEGMFTDILTLAIVTTEGSDALEIPLRGQAVASSLQAWPAMLDFGPVADDEEVERDVTLRNVTGVDVEIWGVQIVGEEDGFDVEAPLAFDAFPWIVAPTEDLGVDVVYEGSGDDSSEATLHFLGRDGIDLGVEVDLIANLCEGSSDPGWDADDDGVNICAGDCDDTNPEVGPGSPEIPDLLDNDCDGLIDEGTPLSDDDGDGFSEAEGDCNDDDVSSYPGADETADGRDNDCDGQVDEGTTVDDSDEDGYTIPAGDCDDTTALTWPGANEIEDGADNDCDGIIDETTSIYDDDGDGYCENATTCIAPWTPGDCNDGDASVFPGNAEVVNGADDDCDGIVDNGTGAADDDGDGYTELGGDCDDSDATVYPGAPELEDGIDNDCDSPELIDEGTAAYDDDGDGFTENQGDCNDWDNGIFPGAPEDTYAVIPGDGDGIDNDCDGSLDEDTNWSDDDGDGFSELGGDCDDTDPIVSPAAFDPPSDGIDWNCDLSD